MTESLLQADESRASPSPEVRSSALASFVAAKLCHDFVSPASALVSGLDLLKDPDASDMHEDALALIDASAKKLVLLANFARVAYGAASSAEWFDPAEVHRLAQGAFEGARANLDWSCSLERFSKPQARAALNLAQIAGGALAHGGTAAIRIGLEGEAVVMLASAEGARARLKAEVVTGLAGRPLEEGLSGQWTQPYWLHTVVAEEGGQLETEVAEDRITVRIRMPA